MENYKPTAGPYQYNEATREISAPDGTTVALVHGPAGPWVDVAEEHHANGRLLAASWELHRQLEALAYQIQSTSGLVVPPGVLSILKSVVIREPPPV